MEYLRRTPLRYEHVPESMYVCIFIIRTSIRQSCIHRNLEGFGHHRYTEVFFLFFYFGLVKCSRLRTPTRSSIAQKLIWFWSAQLRNNVSEPLLIGAHVRVPHCWWLSDVDRWLHTVNLTSAIYCVKIWHCKFCACNIAHVRNSYVSRRSWHFIWYHADTTYNLWSSSDLYSMAHGARVEGNVLTRNNWRQSQRVTNKIRKEGLKFMLTWQSIL